MSGFGDIVFGNTRAVSDDEDDEIARIQEDESLKRKIFWSNGIEKLAVDEIVLADGHNSSAFVYTYLISHIKSDDVKILGLTGLNSISKQDASLRSNNIYAINLKGKKMVICQIFDQLKSNELYDWIGQLTEMIDFKKALIFCSQNKTQYLGEQKPTPFVRFLSSNKDTDDSTRLEQPNFIADLPAALVHYCVSKKLDFITFICYSPSLHADILSIKEMFKAASKKLKDTSPFINDSSSEKSLVEVERIVSECSAIYM